MGWLSRLFGGGSGERNVSIQPVWFREQRGDAELAVVGESFRQENIARVLSTMHNPDAFLMFEPDNPKDRNAVAVYLRGADERALQAGYLDRENARAYGAVMRAVAPGLVFATCVVRGGEYGPAGVWLLLGSPGELMAELMLRDQTPTNDHPAAGKVVAFTGTSRFRIRGVPLDKPGQEYLARRAGCKTWPRVTKQVQLCVCADPNDLTGNLKKAEEYGIEVVEEARFWPRLGYRLDPMT